MSPLELSPEALKVIGKVEKLLALANDSRGNEHQAAAAAAKAQELLEAYNLDMAVIGKTAKGAQRSDNRLKGGLYKWQRDLWQAVAELNFCMYWSIKGLHKGQTYEHRILGRQENVVGARVLAEYLQHTVERIAQETAKERGLNIYVREMIAYREGMTYRLVQRLRDLREQRLEEERAKEREEAVRRQHPAYTGGNGMGLVLASVIEDEECLNLDFLHGREPGTTAKSRAVQKARQAAAMEASDKQLAERKQWLIDHPEEAARIAAEQAAENAKYWKQQDRNARRRTGGHRERQATPEEERRNTAEFYEGSIRAKDIPLNQQMDQGKDKGRLK